jgi:hypothetical protein
MNTHTNTHSVGEDVEDLKAGRIPAEEEAGNFKAGKTLAGVKTWRI